MWSALVTVAQWLVGFALCWRVRRLPRVASVDRVGTVSVIIPARDEALVLPELLERLACQSQSADEVIVVDDHSSDATADVARSHGATVLVGEPLPKGWTGKAWACAQGAHRASGDVLVFLDADTEPEPELLARVVARVRRRGGLVTVQPYHRTGRPVEKLSALFNLVAVMGTGLGSMNPRARVTGAFGACMGTTARDYRTSGGHEAARASVLEDVALANAYRAADLPVDSTGGRGAIAFRMYPRGFGHIVEGWGKNFASGAGTTPLARFALVFFWITACLSLSFASVGAVVDGVTGGGAPDAWFAIAYGAFAVQLFVMLRQVGSFGPGVALFFPVFAFTFLGVFAWSVLNTLVRGEVRWKGRSVRVRDAGAAS